MKHKHNYTRIYFSMMIFITCCITLSNSLNAQQELITLPLIDDRAVGYYEPENNYSSYGLGIIGSDSYGVILRASYMWGPDPIGDWAFVVNSSEIHISTGIPPTDDYTVKMRHINSDPRYQSKSSLYADIGGGTTYGSYEIPSDGLDAYRPVSSSYCDYIENNLSNDWVAGGFQAENESSGINSTLDMQNLKVTIEYSVTNSGTLTNNEKWKGNVNLAGNVIVPSGIALFIDGASVNLNGYYIKSTGGTITNNGTVNPDDIRVEQSGVLKGYYPSVNSALSNASSGQTVHVYSGTFNNNALTVSSGVTLKLDPNVTMQFSGGNGLNVYGTLKAQGTSSNKITFDKSGGSSWYGIKFEDSSVDGNCILEHCIIKNASYGIYCNQATPITIRYCDIRDVGYGIFCYYSPNTGYYEKIQSNTIHATSTRGILFSHSYYNIFGNDIYSNSSIGVHFDDSNPDTYNNDIYQNSSRGVYLSASSPKMHDNNIYGNSGAGIYCYGYSSPSLVNIDGYGNNVITGNGQHGIYVDATSSPYLGSDSENAENSLYSNTQKELYSLQSNQIWANNNWWGTTSPGSNEIYGNVDYDPWLASDPNGSPSNLNVLIARAESDKQPNLFNFGSKGTTNDYDTGYFLELAGEYRKAIAAYQSVVENNPSSSAAMLSLVGIKRCYEYL